MVIQLGLSVGLLAKVSITFFVAEFDLSRQYACPYMSSGSFLCSLEVQLCEIWFMKMCLNERLKVRVPPHNMQQIYTIFVAVGTRQPDRQGYTMGYVN